MFFYCNNTIHTYSLKVFNGAIFLGVLSIAKLFFCVALKICGHNY